MTPETRESVGRPVETSQASADEFRAFLAEIEESQSGFARTLIRLGDDRSKATVLRHVQRMATGEARISGEMRVLMSIFRNSRKKRRAADNVTQTNDTGLSAEL